MHKYAKKVLVIYSNSEYLPRTMFLEHLYSFKKYSNHEIYYLNWFFFKPITLFKFVHFDLIIFHHSITACWNEHRYKKNINLFKKIDFGNTSKIAFFQDECFYTDLLNDFINKLNIQIVFSVATRSLWPTIYSKVNKKKVRFYQVLTGYIDNMTLNKKDYRRVPKVIDIGYRSAWGSRYYQLGSFGYLRKKVVEIFKDKLKNTNLKIDISSNQSDLLSGNKWFEFLSKCKYIIGTESGSSLVDTDGTIKDCILEQLRKQPKSTFFEIRELCFKNTDNKIQLKTMSPRHFESILTRTCQILVRGKYNGILKPWKHYIPLNRDFNNIDQIIKLVENAYNDIVISQKYTYEKFVKYVFNKSRIIYNCENKFLINDSLLLFFRLFEKVNLIHLFIFKYFIQKPYDLINNLFGENNVLHIRKILKI